MKNLIASTRRPHRRGYVLVMTLLLIGVVGLLTAGLARYSLSKAVDSTTKSRDLQARWGRASCQRYALNHSRFFLNRRHWNEETGQWTDRPVKESRCSLSLGGNRYDVVLADESAKLDLNFAYENSNREQTAEIVRRLATTDTRPSVALRPLPERARRGRTEDAFESWGQVFDAGASSGINAFDVFSSTKEMTCWSRQLNYKTAGEEALFEAAKLLVGASTARRLVDARDPNSNESVAELLTRINATERQQQRLSRLLTDQSQSQSVWVSSVDETGPRISLTVREGFTSTLNRIYTFAW